jgi:serine/threonine-protein kinase RsbW
MKHSHEHKKKIDRKLMDEKYVLTLPSNPKEIRTVEEFLIGVNRVAKLDDGAMDRLLIAATEAVNNAILHANKSDLSKLVRLECRITKRALSLSVRDEGNGFDPDRIPDPLKQENLMKESGRGVFLIRSLMDKVKFKSTKRGMTVTMVLKRS